MMENKYFMQMKPEKSWSNCTYIRPKRLEDNDCNKSRGRSSHNDKGVNPIRVCNIYKYLCTQHRTAQITKQILIGLAGGINSNKK